MATRNRTTAFLSHRNQFSSRNTSFGGWDAQNEDQAALVDGDAEYTTLNGAPGSDQLRDSLPPEWVDIVEEVQYNTTRVRQRMKELAALHDKHLNRPSLDESMGEEHAIEIMTQDITGMFHQCQKEIQKIGALSRQDGSAGDLKVCKNVMSALARHLQNLSAQFRNDQSSYLKRLRSRDEREKQFFSTSMGGGIEEVPEDDLDFYNDKGFMDGQLKQLEENTAMITEREKEIQKIAQSLYEVQDIFKELSVLIIDQGTVLDRIDYNVEQIDTSVQKGVEELKGAEKYQKKNRKMLCILLLLVIVIILVFLVAFKK